MTRRTVRVCCRSLVDAAGQSNIGNMVNRASPRHQPAVTWTSKYRGQTNLDTVSVAYYKQGGNEKKLSERSAVCRQESKVWQQRQAAADIRETLAASSQALSALPVTHNSIANMTARKATSSHALYELYFLSSADRLVRTQSVLEYVGRGILILIQQVGQFCFIFNLSNS